MNLQQNVLVRPPDPYPESHMCSLGYIPRHGRTARRTKDCPMDCANYKECDKAHLGIEWDDEEE